MDQAPFNPVPRAVLFDLDDTLCDYESSRYSRLRIAFSLDAEGQPSTRPEEVLRRMIEASITMHPHGVDHFPELFARHGIVDPREAQSAARWYRQNRFHGLQLFPGVAEILQAVRTTGADGAGHRSLGIITNGPAEVQRAKVELLGIADLVDFVLISEEFGAAKPDPRIFEAALDLSNVAAEDAVFIGDAAEFDIAGAHAAGIRSVWVNRRGLGWAGPGRMPDRTVRSIAEVPFLVGSTRDPDGVSAAAARRPAIER